MGATIAMRCKALGKDWKISDLGRKTERNDVRMFEKLRS